MTDIIDFNTLRKRATQGLKEGIIERRCECEPRHLLAAPAGFRSFCVGEVRNKLSDMYIIISFLSSIYIIQNNVYLYSVLHTKE